MLKYFLFFMLSTFALVQCIHAKIANSKTNIDATDAEQTSTSKYVFEEYDAEPTVIQIAFFKYADITINEYRNMPREAYNITRSLFQPLINNFNESNITANQTRYGEKLKQIQQLLAEKLTERYRFINDISNIFPYLKNLKELPVDDCNNTEYNSNELKLNQRVETTANNCTDLDKVIFEAKLKLREEFIKLYLNKSQVIVDAFVDYYNFIPTEEQQDIKRIYDLCMQVRKETDVNKKVEPLSDIAFHF